MKYLKPEHVDILKDIKKKPLTIYDRREKRLKGKDIRSQIIFLAGFELVKTTGGTTELTPQGEAISAAEIGKFHRLYIQKKGSYDYYSPIGSMAGGSYPAPYVNSTNLGSQG